MMKHLALPLIFLFVACNGAPPPPPPPCDGLECLPPCVLNLETCECDCPPPPPPPSCADICAPFQGVEVNNECRCSNDYYVMTRARELDVEAINWDARLIFNGVRHPRAAYEQCGDDVLPYNGYTSWDQIWPVSNRAGEAKVLVFGANGQSGYYANLLIPNQHGFEGRSMVFKPSASPWFGEARALLNGTGTNSHPNGPISRLNGIHVKCEAMQ